MKDEEGTESDESLTEECSGGKTSRKNHACRSVSTERSFKFKKSYGNQDSKGNIFQEDLISSKKIVKLSNINDSNFDNILKIYKNNSEIEELIFFKCFIKFDNNRILNEIPALKHISFEKCDGDFFKIFMKQKSVTKITIINEDPIIDGFSYESLNELMINLKNVTYLVLKGAGTQNYFSCGSYQFKIVILEADSIASEYTKPTEEHWLKFLESQKESLKEMTIKNLPCDFIGGKILKYIFEEMNLSKFSYQDVLLFENGKKKNVSQISGNANQICSIIELLKWYPEIEDLILHLNKTDIDNIQFNDILESNKECFKNLKKLSVIDCSSYRRLLGNFQDILRYSENLKKLAIKSQDKNINAVLEHCLSNLKKMTILKLDSKAPREEERMKIIKENAIQLKHLYIAEESIKVARKTFGDNNRILIEKY